MRKFFVFLSVSLIVACCALPAFAKDFEPEDYVYAPIQFDSINFDYNTGFEFPLNSINIYDFGNELFFETDNFDIGGLAWPIQSGSRYGLDSQFNVLGDFTFYGSNNFIQLDYLEHSDYVIELFSADPNGQVIIDSVTFSFTVVQFMYNDETMVLEPTFEPYSFTLENYGQSDLQLNYYLFNLIRSRIPTFYKDKTVVYVQDLIVDFDLSFVDTDYEMVEIQLSWLGSSLPLSNDSSIFLYQYGPFYTEQGSPENQASLMSFFTDTIGGIMNFELFPGLSFGLIFYIVLVIGIVLWLLTILI